MIPVSILQPITGILKKAIKRIKLGIKSGLRQEGERYGSAKRWYL